ncbi:MAG: TIGR03960 family B12-binding radical SAM protein [Chloroflexi bacterium]|nr:TIGR03960 family B12-binding radical SAM protein [Chloroflexota bacterium]
MLQQLDRILPRVQKPARYTGGEFNSIVKDWSRVALKVALAFPDVYEIGMSNLGLAIIYDLVNQRDDWLAERVYAPWPDMEAELRRVGLPLYALESKRPLRDFDVICFSLAYEQGYTNALTILDLGGIPLQADQRGEEAPLVIAGGPATVNPEPMAAFIDLFVIGDAEEALPDLLARYQAWRAEGGRDRVEFLRRVAALPGIYVPRFYDVTYHPDGTVARIAPNDPAAPPRVRRTLVSTLPPLPVRPIVPFIETVHDRVAVEVMRGCTRGCRFCQPGMVTRPVRERSTEEILATVDQLLRNTGYEEVSLLSLSTSDHSTIDEVATRLAERYADQHLQISLSSLRVDSFSVKLADAVARGKRSGLTFAPEAGTQRLREVINKPLTEEDLLRSVEAAFQRGWTGIKLYFMIGLPTETDEDVVGIVTLIRKVLALGRSFCGDRAEVRVTVSTFVPKPHTPFQWAPQCPPEEIARKVAILQRGLKLRGVKLSWHDAGESRLEAALSRGDRRLGAVIERAFRKGARFDAWSDQFKPELWEEAAAESGLDLSWYAYRRRPLGEVLPWSHIDTGVTEAFLRWDYRRSTRQETTPDCHYDVCSACGLQKHVASCQALFNAAIEERVAVRQAALAAGRGRG